MSGASPVPSREAPLRREPEPQAGAGRCKGVSGSTHVSLASLRAAEDRKIWQYAREHGFTLVSKDTDFRERSIVEGFPPKVIWLDVGNAGTKTIARLLRRELPGMERFEAQTESSFLILALEPNSP